MKGLNKAQLIGNLGQDPEMKDVNGTALAKLRIATTDRYKDKSGEYVDATEWHNVIAWGRLAEIMGEYLSKGSKVYIEGHIQTRSWENDQGETRYSTEIKAREMIMLGGDEQRGGGGGYQKTPRSRGGGGKQQRQPAQQQGGGDFAPDDDLPF